MIQDLNFDELKISEKPMECDITSIVSPRKGILFNFKLSC